METESTSKIEGLENPTFKILPLSDLVPDPENPRVHTAENVEEIARSIQTLGFNNPIQVVPIENDKYKIIAGHGRYLALQKLGIKVVPSIILEHLTDDKARMIAANIADNEIALHSFYDDEKLAIALNELQAMSEDLVMASGIDMDRYLDIAYGNAETGEDSFELNDTTVQSFKADVNNRGDNKFDNYKETAFEDGDVFEINDDGVVYRVMYGDCSDAADMETLMNGAFADLLITDAPTKNTRENRDVYQQRLTESFGIARELLNPEKGGCFYVLYPNETTLETLNALEHAKLFRQQNLIWMINNLLVSGKYDYRVMHENIAFGANDDYEPTFHQDIAYGFTEKKMKSWNNDKRQPTVIQIDTNSTTKPLKLVGYFIKNHLAPKESVLDLQTGNGTELIACHQLHRGYFGIDNDKDAVLTTLCRFAQDTKYQIPIINQRTGEDIKDDLQNLMK